MKILHESLTFFKMTIKTLTKELHTNKDGFWNAIKVICQQPNSVNKEVLYSETKLAYRVRSPLTREECESLTKRFNDFFIQNNDGNNIATSVLNKPLFEELDHSEIFTNTNGVYIMTRQLYPKKVSYTDMAFYEFCYFDFESTRVRYHTFFNKKLPVKLEENNVGKGDPYLIAKFKEIELCFANNLLTVMYDDSLGEKSVNWLSAVFVNKLAKIALSKTKTEKKNNGLTFSSQVNVMNYYKLYEQLKSKYGKILVENWSENTDPQKFVFEDIGIATYLLLLWNNGELPDDKSIKQKFVDLGCGNGLLVYILNSEGHAGIGLDIRKRKIWDTYPSYVVLKEETIIPGPNSIYPDADWLIGNHSDELTPWLPIMARRSGSQCQYFVLPCCPFQLNGKVFQRKNSRVSVYQDFVQYVSRISEVCEFETSVDRLRIPSTKRICIIGRKKSLSHEELDSVRQRIDAFISEESCGGTANSELGEEHADRWLPEFKVRDAVESVRNCTRLPRDFLDSVVLIIAKHLLSSRNVVTVRVGNETRTWNRGGSVPLREVAQVLTQEQLKRLKNESKGLQTLMKNHHYVFKVSGGEVRLRTVEEMAETSRRVLENGDYKWKRKDCWFRYYHPDGCPLEDADCSYKHGYRRNMYS